MDKEYGSWSLKDLKDELKKRNAKTTGKKAVLVERLQDYDKLFGPLITASDTVFKIAVPSPEHFRDITSASQMPNFTNEDLEIFCYQTERENLTTSVNMYKENFLISCRRAYVNGDYYITGLCASEMRKNIQYLITIKLKDNIILEAQCECAAGAGPYGQCKHILVLLNGIVDHNESKTIILKASCTSNLQTFHHPRTSYSGEPITTANLTLKFKNKKLKEMTNYDPRSVIVEDEMYKTYFYNTVFNYSGHNENMPIKQLRLPADKMSLYSEHDYLQETSEEAFFKSLFLTPVQINELEEKTRSNKKIWLNLRKYRLQSSDFGKICKQKSNKMNLSNSLINVNYLETPAIKHGRKYEPIAIKLFEELTNVKTIKCGITIHPTEQYLGSTPDALVGNDEILEIKCPYSASNKMISGETVPYIGLCEISGDYYLKQDHEYYFQVQGQLYCSQRKVANFFIYTISDHLLIRITRNESFIENMLLNLKNFYDIYYKKTLLNRFLYNKKT